MLEEILLISLIENWILFISSDAFVPVLLHACCKSPTSELYYYICVGLTIKLSPEMLHLPLKIISFGMGKRLFVIVFTRQKLLNYSDWIKLTVQRKMTSIRTKDTKSWIFTPNEPRPDSTRQNILFFPVFFLFWFSKVLSNHRNLSEQRKIIASIRRKTRH